MSNNTVRDAEFDAPQHSQPADRPIRSVFKNKSILIVLCVMLIVGYAWLMIAASSRKKIAARDRSNMMALGMAILNYESAFKTLPAPRTINAKNEPVWSWTVSILPFMGERELYDEKLDRKGMTPWDSPQNSALQGPSPAILKSNRANHPPGSTSCNVFVIVGTGNYLEKNTAFVDGMYRRWRGDDGSPNTILAIMLAKHSTPWAKPTMLSPDEAYQLIQQEKSFFFATMGDGSVKAFPMTIDRASFDALITVYAATSIKVEELEYD